MPSFHKTVEKVESALITDDDLQGDVVPTSVICSHHPPATFTHTSLPTHTLLLTSTILHQYLLSTRLAPVGWEGWARSCSNYWSSQLENLATCQLLPSSTAPACPLPPSFTQLHPASPTTCCHLLSLPPSFTHNLLPSPATSTLLTYDLLPSPATSTLLHPRLVTISCHFHPPHNHLCHFHPPPPRLAIISCHSPSSPTPHCQPCHSHPATPILPLPSCHSHPATPILPLSSCQLPLLPPTRPMPPQLTTSRWFHSERRNDEGKIVNVHHFLSPSNWITFATLQLDDVCHPPIEWGWGQPPYDQG